MKPFSGSKVALIHNNDQLVAIQRDDKPSIRWPNMWEMPGGAREGHETPEECAVREVQEELGIQLSLDAFVWQRPWPAMHDPSQVAWFLVAPINYTTLTTIKLGNEGQAWRLMAITEFLSRDDVIPGLKERLQDYLSHRATP